MARRTKVASFHLKMPLYQDAILIVSKSPLIKRICHAFKHFKNYIPVRNLLSTDNGQTFPLEDEHFEVCGLIMIDLTRAKPLLNRKTNHQII